MLLNEYAMQVAENISVLSHMKDPVKLQVAGAF
jgi:hypothetical protein